jgi:acyl carrier protein
MSVQTEIRDFIARELSWDGTADELTPEFPLLEKEVVDSLGIFKIISFLETTYDIEIDDDDLVPDNFESIEKISGLVTGKVDA